MRAGDDIAIVEAWIVPRARAFFRNVWPLYVHEISAFDTDFYSLDASGRWMPDIVEDWVAVVTPPQNLLAVRAADDPAQPFQRTHVITSGGRPVGFACIAFPPFRYMPDDADVYLAEYFLIHAARGTPAATRALDLLRSRYPGRWQLRVIHDNERALRFWRKALPAIGAQALEQRLEEEEVVFRFVSG